MKSQSMTFESRRWVLALEMPWFDVTGFESTKIDLFLISVISSLKKLPKL